MQERSEVKARARSVLHGLEEGNDQEAHNGVKKGTKRGKEREEKTTLFLSAPLQNMVNIVHMVLSNIDGKKSAWSFVSIFFNLEDSRDWTERK